MDSNHDLLAAVQLLKNSRYLAVCTGAGVSKESGIPTFREAQTGYWSQYDPEQLATPHAFQRDPELVWSWYIYRHKLVNDAQPNPGHTALVELESLHPRMVLLTQNVDGLHRRAGSTDIVELHGSLNRFKCFAACQGEPTPYDLSPADVESKSPPACPHCGAHIRPDVVWFTEVLYPDVINRAFSVASSCDLMLVIGTSGIVHPAAGLPVQAKRSGASIIEINPQRSGVSSLADIFLPGPSGEILPALVNAWRTV